MRAYSSTLSETVEELLRKSLRTKGIVSQILVYYDQRLYVLGAQYRHERGRMDFCISRNEKIVHAQTYRFMAWDIEKLIPAVVDLVDAICFAVPPDPVVIASKPKRKHALYPELCPCETHTKRALLVESD